MATGLVQQPAVVPSTCSAQQKQYPPISYFYTHLHARIREELASLAAWVRCLEGISGDALQEQLQELRARYRFLEQVNKYHSDVEDEVVYPALDSKVKNVTLAYSVEHQDEELLFEQLSQLLSTATNQNGAAQLETVRKLICKVEEIHTTLKKHLAKEEEQLLPLLLLHFSHAEQAELVAQFLYCIPLATVEKVLLWLKPAVPKAEQEQLLEHIRNVIPDGLLLQLLVAWLQPSQQEAGSHEGPSQASQNDEAGPFNACCGNLLSCKYMAASAQAAPTSNSVAGVPTSNGMLGVLPASNGMLGVPPTSNGVPGTGSGDSRRPPLKEIIHFHRSICSALEAFAQEARQLQSSADVSGAQLSSLLERHRFLRSVCMFHTISEEEVMYPAVRRIEAQVAGMDAAYTDAACQTCSEEHEHEISLFEELGRLLADVRAFARRGRKEVSQMLEQLCSTAEQVCGEMAVHMQREEAQLFPLLEQHLCPAQQRALVWRTLRAMPLRLLERVMPWIVAKLSDADTMELLTNIQLGAPQADTVLVELLMRWAARGRARPLDQQKPAAMDATAAGAGGAGAAAAAGVAATAAAAAAAGSPFYMASMLQQCSTTAGTAASDRTLCRVYNDTSTAPSSSTGDWDLEDGAPAKRRRISLAGSSSLGSGAIDVLAPIQDCCCSCKLISPTAGSGAPAATAAVTAAAAATATFAAANGANVSGLGDNATTVGNSSAGRLSSVPHADTKAKFHGSGFNPIDHIFQFHKALRQELRQLEQDAMTLEHVVLECYNSMDSTCSANISLQLSTSGSSTSNAPTAADLAATAAPLPPPPPPQAAAAAAAAGSSPALEPTPNATDANTGHPMPSASSPMAPTPFHAPTAAAAAVVALPKGCAVAVQQLDGRFHFLWGIYQAHSKSEDEIVFPALESKQALRNVSHAYTLDHQREEQLFIDLHQVIDSLKASGAVDQLREQSLAVRRMCAAIRATLETHIRAEEAELWPLFAEHFSIEEQQYLVGVIIGRTGAQVLQALLPWIQDSIPAEEQNALMDSLRQATKNTMFDQWLDAVQAPKPSATAAAGANSAQPAGSETSKDDLQRPLHEVAQYLAGTQQGAEPQGVIAESSSFRPGWEDIFRMNQKQLEAAIHRVSNDPNLEPDRKAYLIQNIMVSRYIVAQQKRMREGAAAATAAAAGHSSPGTACSHGHEQPAAPAAPPAAGQGQEQAGVPAHPPPAATAAIAAAAYSHGHGHKTYHDASSGVLGCKHYKRKCQLIAPCCGQAFTCRLCHDEACDHRMDRYAVTRMVCMGCGLQQPVAQSCSGCSAQLARYYCSICHLFDDDPNHDIYHCPFCNVCRRGKGLGIDFFHCMNCNACMSLSLANSHKCREKCLEGNCPVCSEYLFDSSQPVKELPCGHLMHSTCFAAYTQYNYTCPMCCKSIGDMSVYFQMLDSLLVSERLPPEYASRMQQVLCHDCGKMGFAPFHFVYHSCPHCRSYNTRIL